MPDRFTGSRRVIDGIPSSSVPGDEYYNGGFYQMRGPGPTVTQPGNTHSRPYRVGQVDLVQPSIEIGSRASRRGPYHEDNSSEYPRTRAPAETSSTFRRQAEGNPVRPSTELNPRLPQNNAYHDPPDRGRSVANATTGSGSSSRHARDTARHEQSDYQFSQSDDVFSYIGAQFSPGIGSQYTTRLSISGSLPPPPPHPPPPPPPHNRPRHEDRIRDERREHGRRPAHVEPEHHRLPPHGERHQVRREEPQIYQGQQRQQIPRQEQRHAAPQEQRQHPDGRQRYAERRRRRDQDSEDDASQHRHSRRRDYHR